MHKKILTLALCATMLTASLTGCSTTETKSIITGSEAISSDGSQGMSDVSSDGSTDSANASSGADITIAEQVLVDQDGIKITATGYESDGLFGDAVDILVENNSSNDYTIGCDALIVNDFMIADLFSVDVAAGKKSNETIDLYSSELEAAGIDSVGKIEFYFHAYDANWDNLFSGVYSEIDTSEFANMDTTADDTGSELYNANGVRIVGKTVDENSFWGTAILVYVENTSGRNINVTVEDLSVNGFMIEPYFYETVYDGKKSIGTIDLMSTELEQNGITSVDNVELKFSITDNDTYETIATSDVVSFSAQ